MRNSKHASLAPTPEPSSSAVPGPTPAFVALCIDARHPTLAGRVKIRRELPDAPANTDDRERWVPVLHGLSIRVGDRLLMQRAEGLNEPIVVGVIDGFFPRPEPARPPGQRVVLERDEAMHVESPDGQVLLEIVQDEAGPVVRLLGDATRVELAGKLSIKAAELELEASHGAVRIEATDELRLIGETIQLNP
jgi:hypothetical protein